LKLTIALLTMLIAMGTPAQTNSCFPHCHQCEVYVADMASRRILKTVKFRPLTGEEELTNRVFRIPATRLMVTASVFYTDESMASKAGADSMQLALAVSNHSWSQAFASPNNAVTEITLSTFDTARVETNVRSGSSRLLIGMECKDKSSN
jgi:hypothetical protein